MPPGADSSIVESFGCKSRSEPRKRRKAELESQEGGKEEGIILVSVREPSQSVPENGDVEVD
jgi:hypothetical protein